MALLVVVLVGGVGTSIFGASLAGFQKTGTPATPSESPTAAPSSTPSATPSPRKDSSGKTSPSALKRSVPKRLSIKAIGLKTRLQELGKNSESNTVSLPAPVTRAGWYKKSAAPGQVGVALIVGYIRAGRTPGVFRNLDALRPGDKISVRRRDGEVAVFRVTTIKTYKRGTLPARKLYAATRHPVLRLITSGGKLHPSDPVGNVVVSARLIGAR